MNKEWKGIRAEEVAQAWADWKEIGDCMKCGTSSILIESRDGYGAHACEGGCPGRPPEEQSE